MRTIKSFDPTATTSGTFDPGIANPCGILYLFNESPIGLLLTFPDGSTATLPPYFFRFYYVSQPGLVQWGTLYNIPTTGLTSSVYGESYESNESGSIALTHGPLNRQTNIGNSVPVGTSATSIANSGNPPGTSIITAQPSDAASATWTADNSGNLTIKSDNVGTLSTLLQLIAGASPAVKLAAATIATEILGALNVDGALTVTGVSNLNGGVFTTSPTLTGGKIFGTGGWTWVDFSNNSDFIITPNGGQVKINSGVLNATAGLFTTSPTFTGGKIFGTGGWVWIDFSDNSNFIITPNGGRLKLGNNASIQFADGSLVNRIHGFNGTGSGTFNHSNGVTPNNVQLTTHQVGSQTMGYDSENSTNLHVTTGAGLTWTGLAFSLA